LNAQSWLEAGPDVVKQAAPAGSAAHWRVWQLVQQLAALLLLLAATPLVLLLLVLVKCDSRGPFLYSQRRPGLRGRPFTAWKIRTMTVGADRNPMLARAVTSGSPEVTRVGRYLRDLKIDELPQLWNIVRGDMVFVGPRPIAPSLQEYLESRIPGFELRLTVPPGLTSLGQVCIDENDAVERVVQDWSVRFEGERHYLAHRSVSYDLVIIGMTFAYCLRKVLRRLPRSARSSRCSRCRWRAAPRRFRPGDSTLPARRWRGPCRCRTAASPPRWSNTKPSRWIPCPAARPTRFTVSARAIASRSTSSANPGWRTWSCRWTARERSSCRCWNASGRPGCR
jgi:lipopolysaccharide/colanic/teichoic acid biosynthesis glycosyltransferase